MDEPTQQQIDTLDEVVRRVAAQMPFPVDLYTDMGWHFVAQIELGRRGGPDDSPDRAMIDPGVDEKWWLDVEGGRESIESPFGRAADPAEVAQWITEQAREWGSPAALASTDFPSSPSASISSSHADAQPDRTRASREPGSELGR